MKSMLPLKRARALALMLTMIGCQPSITTPRDPSAVLENRVRELLAAYASNDPDRVVALCDSDQVAIFGSDVAELARTSDEVRAMIADDFKLWGTAKLGEPRDIDTQVGSDLASVFFNVPFRAGEHPEVIVRIATVWRRRGNTWRLAASSNTVPTTGSSARALLGRQASRP